MRHRLPIAGRACIALTFASTLAGCVSTPVCVAVDNPNERVIAGRISGKQQIDGKVLIRAPRTVQVTNPGPGGNAIAQDIVVLLAVGAIGAAAGADPVLMSSQITAQMADPALHSGYTTPPSSEVEVGEPCEPRDVLLEHGATRYTVHTDQGEYFVHSAYPGFSLEQCVKLFISDNQGTLQSRIASGSQCPKG